ncbi:MAG: hypothetical protein F6K30_09530 [Cyanothece sp. SIO2G6]|nr:hypothetical protein [Cyanothece sp. SIO2G6]
MKLPHQADRQWLDYLYSKSPSSELGRLLFQTYYQCKRALDSFKDNPLFRKKTDAIKVTYHCDRYNNVIWHAHNSALNLSFSTYSHQELQHWLAIHNTLNQILSTPEQQRSTGQKS